MTWRSFLSTISRGRARLEARFLAGDRARVHNLARFVASTGKRVIYLGACPPGCAPCGRIISGEPILPLALGTPGFGAVAPGAIGSGAFALHPKLHAASSAAPTARARAARGNTDDILALSYYGH